MYKKFFFIWIIKFIKIFKVLLISFVIIFIFSLINNKKFVTEEDLNNIQNYINICLKHKLIKNKIFSKNHNPEISIVISVFNGEPYLKTALRSIQNQDFNNIEIIIVDDFSKDNSINLIKSLMKEDHRIIFLNNKENKGSLYTKIKGIFNSKGKYILTLDVDDLYTSKYVFSNLYREAEKRNLDLLGFSLILSDKAIKNKLLNIHHYWETEVLFQPNVSYMMYSFDENNNPRRVGDVISGYFMKREVLIKSIKEIDNNFLNKKIIRHDDLFIFFLLSRNAKNLKQIKRLYYLVLLNYNYNKTLVNFHDNEKKKLHLKYGCLSYLYYIQFILKKTENTYRDKKIASFELENWYLNNSCRNNTYSRKYGIYLCTLFLKNNFINIDIKKRIKIFLKELEEV